MKALLLVLGVCLGFFIGLVVAWQPLPMERLYKEYNHMRVYEDGSYVGETRQGTPIDGCLTIAICNEVQNNGN